MAIEQELLAALKELNRNIQKLPSGGNTRASTARGSNSDIFADLKKELRSTLKDYISEMNDFIDIQQKNNKKASDYAKNHEAITKQIQNADGDLLKTKKLQEKQFEHISKMADHFDGSVELMDKKAKQWAGVLAASSKTFGAKFKDFDGGLSDMQSTIREFVSMRAEIAKMKEAEIASIEESKKKNLAANKELRKLTQSLQAATASLEETRKNPDPGNRGNGAANLAAAENLVKEIEDNIDSLKKLKKEESKYRAELNKSYKQNEAFVAELDTTIKSVSDFGAELFDATTSANLFSKELDIGKRKFKDMAKDWSGFTTVSIIGGLSMMKDAALEIADKYRIIADVGMAGTMTKFASTALTMGLTISQLARIVGENRAAFAKSGMSIGQFGDMAKSNAATLQSVGLSYEQSASAQAKMMNGAISMLGSDQKRNSDAIRKSVSDQVKSFRVLTAATGETVDALAVEYESMLKDEDIAKKLQSLSGKERQAASNSLLLEFQHYKLLGLNNEQMKAAINLKNANQYRLGERVSGGAQIGVAMKAVGMDDAQARRAQELSLKRNKTTTEMKEFTDLMSQAQQKKNNIDNNGSDTQKEIIDSIFAGFSNNKLFQDAWKHGSDINAAQSNGSAQMTVAQANEQLMKAQAAGTDKMVAAYAAGVEKTNAAIGNLIKQASPSGDAMAVVGQKTENVKAFVDALKDSPFGSAAKMILGAGIALLAAARMLMKSSAAGGSGSGILDSIGKHGKGRGVKRAALKVGGRGMVSGAKGIMKGGMKMGAKLLKGLPYIGAIAGLALEAKDIYDSATEEADPKEKREKLTKSISSAAGSIIGGTVGMIFGGPVGAIIGGMAGDYLGGLLGDGINYIVDNWKNITDWCTKTWTDMTNWISGKWSSITGWVKEQWDSISGWVSKTVSGIWKSVQENPMFQFLADAVGWYVDKWIAIKDWVVKVTSPVVDAVKKMNPFSWLQESIDWLLDKWIALNEKLPDWMMNDASKASLAGAKKMQVERNAAKAASASAPPPVAGATASIPPAKVTGSPSQPGSSPIPIKVANEAPTQPWKPSATNAGAPAAAQQPSGDAYLNTIMSWNGGVAGDLSHFKKLDPGLQQRVVQYAEAYHRATGKKLQINSAFRTKEEQEKIAAKAAPGIAAVPGTSPHEKGIGIDIDPSSIRAANAAGMDLKQYGLWQPLANKAGEFQHVQPAGVAANNRQAAELGILSPAAAVKGGGSPPAPAPARTQMAAVPAIGNATSANNGSYGGSGSSSSGVGGSSTTSSRGGTTGGNSFGGSGKTEESAITLLAKIASLNTEQLAELRNIVSATKTSTTTSFKDMMASST
jgi:hypothetical protein